MDDLHLTRLTTQAVILPPIGGLAQAVGLGAQDSARIYAGISRFGFASLQMIPGGAQFASPDGRSQFTVSGNSWAFAEDLEHSAFQLAIDKLAVSVKTLLALHPGSRFLSHVIDLQARWDNVDARSYLDGRFFNDQVSTVVSGIDGYNFDGAGLRLHLARPVPDHEVPKDVQVIGRTVEELDIRIEPLFADPTKLFLEVTGQYHLPTDDLTNVTKRTTFVKDTLWKVMADRLAADD